MTEGFCWTEATENQAHASWVSSPTPRDVENCPVETTHIGIHNPGERATICSRSFPWADLPRGLYAPVLDGDP